MQKTAEGLTEQSAQIVKSLLAAPEFSGQIPANQVERLAKAEGKDVAGLMVALLPVARKYSHPPISNYRVGAVARGSSGSLYLGMNVEIPGHSLGFSVHGEQAALSSAYMHGEQGVAGIAVTAAPCGHCRQFMTEMAPDGRFEILVEGKPPMQLSTLLPMAFGPKDLGLDHGGAFPDRGRQLAALAAAADGVTRAAWDAAGVAYAPYSHAPSGVAIGTKAGRVYKGSYLENAAFNPSLSPLQTALVQLLLAGEEYSSIARVVLVEIKDAKISQASVTTAVLSTIAAEVKLERVSVSAT